MKDVTKDGFKLQQYKTEITSVYIKYYHNFSRQQFFSGSCFIFSLCWFFFAFNEIGME
jgi:hypothetical protein